MHGSTSIHVLQDTPVLGRPDMTFVVDWAQRTSGLFQPRDEQALFSPIHYHFPSQSAYSGHFVQRSVFYVSFQFRLVVRYVSLNCSLSVCLEGKENGRLATFDAITWKQPIIYL